jgi:hypothetical protein
MRRCHLINCNNCITMHFINNLKSLRLLRRICRSKPELTEEHYVKLCHYSRGSNRVHQQPTEAVFF